MEGEGGRAIQTVAIMFLPRPGPRGSTYVPSLTPGETPRGQGNH